MTLTDSAGVTFAVDDVTPAAAPLAVEPAHAAVRRRLDGRLESCSDYHGSVVREIDYQPLLAAVYTAFSQHRPLILSPDAVWVTIAQGVAHHMAIHGERLRSRFVAHAGKLTLNVTVAGWVPGSPENPWADAFAGWAEQIRDHVGPAVHDALVCDFSTTGPAERAASRIVLMDVFERYFHYAMYCICGIPTVTLTGTPADWHRLVAKAEGLRPFDLDWWLDDHLLPVCRQFARAADGDVDVGHWQAICKLRSEYGGHVINGWVAKLFPYLQAFINGPCTRRNPVFETGEGMKTFMAPPGLSKVPFTWTDEPTGRTRSMEAVGGLLGVAQDERTMALRPTVGWAVREADAFDVLLDRLADDGHATRPGIRPVRTVEGGWHLATELTSELGRFYQRTDGADLFVGDPVRQSRVVPSRYLVPLDGQPVDAELKAWRDSATWKPLVWLADGGCLAVNLQATRPEAGRWPAVDRRFVNWDEWDQFAPVCHVSPTTAGRPGHYPVVAVTFAELLGHLLDHGGDPAWLAVDRGYGDAADHTPHGGDLPTRPPMGSASPPH